MPLPYVYRVTKYDPADRDEHGHYTGDEDVVSDHGEVESAYLAAVEAFATDAGVDRLSVREPQIPGLVHFGAEPPMRDFGLDGLFPGPVGFHDGAEIPLATGLELVRVMLRDGGAWCRLEVEGVFAVHVGRDQYLYVGSNRPGEQAAARTRALGLFPERLTASPYDMDTDGEQQVQRPGDDEFWAALHWSVTSGRAGLLEETYVEGASRRHRLTSDTIDSVRAGIAPRARLAVWPDLSSDIDAVLGVFPADGLVEGVWQDEDGRIHGVVTDESGYQELADRISGAVAAALLSLYADERVPLSAAVMPDPDGVVRALWRTDPTPGDRSWAFRKTLGRGDIVTGTVSCIAEIGVTFVDLGGCVALINLPELSWRHVDHPCDILSVGQEINAKILDIDPVRERVSLSLKALHEERTTP
ncbi:S1 RNA-binding domain-containing protein [Streptomyces sp. HUAS TT20]|uniref:S1 RNA-binding domain-containing protein n=1 Tax=Streptomyces sp. HUAS TT20 TaxID=3447509 RepID=UPI0021DA3D69|nr:S1 RNA-binding domain-containing protein [Streptomyces sp. HUAS 15-9]UXY31670.1 S1 RNA-binding domain-containing protein [Streptomyces sp. HUAS 15-9]